jgi:hypothetical protein
MVRKVYRRLTTRTVEYYEYYLADNERQLEFKSKTRDQGLITRSQVGEEVFQDGPFEEVTGPELTLLAGRYPTFFKPNSEYNRD